MLDFFLPSNQCYCLCLGDDINGTQGMEVGTSMKASVQCQLVRLGECIDLFILLNSKNWPQLSFSDCK